MYTKDLHLEQIRNRYAIYDRPVNGMSNVIIDSFFPSYLLKSYQYNGLQEQFPKTFGAISEFTAQTTGVPLVPREELCKMLGYNLKDIKQLMLAVKRKKLKLAMIGLGGTNSNTLYWLKELALLTNTVNLFKDMIIFENDNLSLDNIIRMPMSTLNIQSSKHLADPEMLVKSDSVGSIAYTLRNLEEGFLTISEAAERIRNNLPMNSFSIPISRQYSSRKVNVSKLELVTSEYYLLSENKLALTDNYYKPDRHQWMNEYGSYKSIKKPLEQFIFYGAPDIQTRQDFHSANLPLITTTHGDDDISIMLNPLQDSTLQVESYGVIKLGIFFMNQIRATIGLLELLASDTDLTQPNQSFLEFSYTSNDKTKPTIRQWQMQLDHDGLLRS